MTRNVAKTMETSIDETVTRLGTSRRKNETFSEALVSMGVGGGSGSDMHRYCALRIRLCEQEPLQLTRRRHRQECERV